MLKRIGKRLYQLFEVARYARRASYAYHTSAFTLFRRALPICLHRRFTGEEAFRLGLLDPRLRDDDLNRYCSRKELTRVQKALNPEPLIPWVRNKVIFYRFCLAHDLPVPKLYAVFSRQTGGWACGGRFLAGPDQWTTFIERDLPDEFVVKPAESAFGQGVVVLRRQSGHFVDAGGTRHTAKAVYDGMATDPQHDCFLIQQRLHNHPDLIHLTGVEYLQTARINTFVDAACRCHLIHSHFKLIGRSNTIDNFGYGRTGNLQARVDLSDGRLRHPFTASPGTPGVVVVEEHPNTGLPIEGFQLPFWSDACDLVRRAADLFLPIRVIGWDVALTPEGPAIIEGNLWWDPTNLHGNARDVVRAITEPAPKTQMKDTPSHAGRGRMGDEIQPSNDRTIPV